MNLADLITSAVAIAKSVTAGLQATITLESFSADDAYGNRSYGSPVTHKVIIEYKDRFVTARDMSQQLSKASVQFIGPVVVRDQDRITMPDGSKPQIISVEGVFDPTGKCYAPKVYF